MKKSHSGQIEHLGKLNTPNNESMEQSMRKPSMPEEIKEEDEDSSFLFIDESMHKPTGATSASNKQLSQYTNHAPLEHPNEED